MFLLFVRITSF